jgi:hypothetical protein
MQAEEVLRILTQHVWSDIRLKEFGIGEERCWSGSGLGVGVLPTNARIAQIAPRFDIGAGIELI